MSGIMICDYEKEKKNVDAGSFFSADQTSIFSGSPAETRNYFLWTQYARGFCGWRKKVVNKIQKNMVINTGNFDLGQVSFWQIVHIYGLFQRAAFFFV